MPVVAEGCETAFSVTLEIDDGPTDWSVIDDFDLATTPLTNAPMLIRLMRRS